MDDYGTPQSRIEALLQNILGASYDIGDPQSRNEALLIAICEELEGTPSTAITSDEITEIVNDIE